MKGDLKHVLDNLGKTAKRVKIVLRRRDHKVFEDRRSCKN